MVSFGFFSGAIGTWLNEFKRLAGKIRYGSGALLIMLGLSLLVPQRH